MSGFSAQWLAQREAIDASARNIKLTDALRHRYHGDTWREVVDLATGTGANLRYLAPRLKGRQNWLLVDHDATLLSQLPEHMSRWATANGFSLAKRADHMIVRGESFDCRLRLLKLDLATQFDRLSFEGCHVVTASALLDLVSEKWLHELIRRCQSAQVVILFTLTYDGHIAWSPAEPDDQRIRALVNRHQRNDKGFGPALGPAAIQSAMKYLTDRDYLVRSENSAWHLGPRHHVLQHHLLQGWTEAMFELPLETCSWIKVWAQHRRFYISKRRSSLIVGHVDVLGWPT